MASYRRLALQEPGDDDEANPEDRYAAQVFDDATPTAAERGLAGDGRPASDADAAAGAPAATGATAEQRTPRRAAGATGAAANGGRSADKGLPKLSVNVNAAIAGLPVSSHFVAQRKAPLSVTSAAAGTVDTATAQTMPGTRRQRRNPGSPQHRRNDPELELRNLLGGQTEDDEEAEAAAEGLQEPHTVLHVNGGPQDDQDGYSVDSVDAVIHLQGVNAAPPSRKGATAAPQPTTPFPWAPCLLIYGVVVSNGIALQVPNSFLPSMLIKRFGIPETDVGLLAGALAGSFSFAEFCSSFAIGHLSDKIGRRPIMVFGLFVCGMLLSVYGLSPTFTIALLNRILEGLLNSTGPVAKAYLSDIIKDPAHRPLAFGYFGASFSAARVVANSLAGYLVALGPPDTIWEFAVPGLVFAPLLWLSSIGICCCLPAVKQAKPASGRVATRGPTLKEGLAQIWQDKIVSRVIALYAITSFANGGVLLADLLLFALPRDHMGLGLSPSEIGTIFTVMGAAALLFQFVFLKPVLARWNARDVCSRIGTMCIATSSFLLPISALPVAATTCTNHATSPATVVHCGPNLEWLMWTLMIFAMTIQAIGLMTALPMVHTMLSNAADPAIQGLTQGTAQSLGSLFRSAGPILCGIVFSACAAIKQPFWVFFALGCCYSGSIVLAESLPISVALEVRSTA